jgi:hypothetical protein
LPNAIALDGKASWGKLVANMVSLSDLQNGPKVFETIFGARLGPRLWRVFAVIAVLAILFVALDEIGGIVTKAVSPVLAWLTPPPKSPAAVSPPVSAPPLGPAVIPAPPLQRPKVEQAPTTEGDAQQPDKQPQASVREKTAAVPDRIFINVPPEYLISLYGDRSAYQARNLTQVYVGRWMRVSGPLGPIRGPTEYGGIFLSFRLGDLRSIHMTFDRHWADRFAVLTPGQTITAVCQLRDVDSLSVDLDKCELAAE